MVLGVILFALFGDFYSENRGSIPDAEDSTTCMDGDGVRRSSQEHGGTKQKIMPSSSQLSKVLSPTATHYGNVEKLLLYGAFTLVHIGRVAVHFCRWSGGAVERRRALRYSFYVRHQWFSVTLAFRLEGLLKSI
ncbi:hypothetical protein CQ011_05475 [Arthrobacter sp. MYb213]|nr:hypothetical protein CQ011_05475 [Arthrobacter sp. MYb213]